MNDIFRQTLNIMKKNLTFLLTRAATAALCAAIVACNNDEPDKTPDETAFWNALESAPVKIVPKETLPGWLIEKIDTLESLHDGINDINILKGELDGRVIYYIRDMYSSCLGCEVYDGETGEKPTGNGSIWTESSNWILVYRIVGLGILTRSEFADDEIAIKDIYDFPQLSTKWEPHETIQSRLNALQIPEDLLITISTAGLLETCLNFPYLIDIFFQNDYQQGFEALCSKFNGFREILKRPDLSKIVLTKYRRMGKEVAEVTLLKDTEKGKFSFRHFVLEMIMAQDVTIKSMDKEQEKHLFSMSIEQTKIERNNPTIFRGCFEI